MLPVALLAMLASGIVACARQTVSGVTSAPNTGVANARTGCAVGQAVGAVAEALDPNLRSTQQAIEAGCADLRQIETTP